jgi:hypothetical protein
MNRPLQAAAIARQQRERTALQLQARRAVASVQLLLQLAHRGGVDTVKAELRQLAELGSQAGQLLEAYNDQ